MSEPVPFHIRIETSVGPIAGNFAVSPEPMRLSELVPLVASLSSVIIGRALKRDREGQPSDASANDGDPIVIHEFFRRRSSGIFSCSFSPHGQKGRS